MPLNCWSPVSVASTCHSCKPPAPTRLVFVGRYVSLIIVRPLVTLMFQAYPVDGFSSSVTVNVSPLLTFTVLLLSDWLKAAIVPGDGVADGVAVGEADGVTDGVTVVVQADTMTMPAMAIIAMPESAKDFLSK